MAEDFPTGILLISAKFSTENGLSTELSVNMYLMYINAGEPPPAPPGVQEYFEGVEWRVSGGGPARSFAICANTKCG